MPSEDLVEVEKKKPQEPISERSEAIKVCQEYVEVVKNNPQERISGRMCEQREVIDVTEISSQCPSLLRIVEQMIDVTRISDIGGEFWQRTVNQFLDLFHECLRTFARKGAKGAPDGQCRLVREKVVAIRADVVLSMRVEGVVKC